MTDGRADGRATDVPQQSVAPSITASTFLYMPVVGEPLRGGRQPLTPRVRHRMQRIVVRPRAAAAVPRPVTHPTHLLVATLDVGRLASARVGALAGRNPRKPSCRRRLGCHRLHPPRKTGLGRSRHASPPLCCLVRRRQGRMRGHATLR
eukprot:scaffold61249_cov64-Phaeocystis_antarctica.AAC.3